MANSFWNFVTQFVPNTLAKAEDVNTNLSGVEAGFTLVEAQTLQSIKITDTPGVVNISSTPANRANKIVSFDGTGGVLATIYIGNYQGNHAAVAGTVYNVRDTVKDSTGALGQDNIYICNTSHTSTGDLAADVANWDILVDVAAVAVSAAAALVSENNAAASFTSFDNRYLGAKAADPTLDNSGGALIDGATYFDTTLNRMKVYDLGTTTWSLTTANAVDVSIADAGGLLNGTNAESAIQELAGASIPVNATGTNTAMVLTYGLPAPASGDMYTFTATANMLAGSTVAVDGDLARPILLPSGLAISNQDILVNGTYTIRNNTGNYYLLNPSRTKNNLTVKNAMTLGNEADLSHFAGFRPFRFGQSGLLYGRDADLSLWLANNFYLSNLGNDTAIATGTSALIKVDQAVVSIQVSPSANAGTAPAFKTPFSVDVPTGIITVTDLENKIKGFQANKLATQAIVAAATVEFATEVFDSNAWYNVTTYKFTPLVAGQYLFILSVSWESLTSNDQLVTEIVKNTTGGVNGHKWSYRASGTEHVFNASIILSANGTTDSFWVEVNNLLNATSSVSGKSSTTTTTFQAIYQGY